MLGTRSASSLGPSAAREAAMSHVASGGLCSHTCACRQSSGRGSASGSATKVGGPPRSTAFFATSAW